MILKRADITQNILSDDFKLTQQIDNMISELQKQKELGATHIDISADYDGDITITTFKYVAMTAEEILEADKPKSTIYVRYYPRKLE